MTLNETLESLLRTRPQRKFRSEEELRLLLKRRLTKKEYKILFLGLESQSEEEIRTKLKLTQQRYAELRNRIRIKLNKSPLYGELFLPEAPA